MQISINQLFSRNVTFFYSRFKRASPLHQLERAFTSSTLFSHSTTAESNWCFSYIKYQFIYLDNSAAKLLERFATLINVAKGRRIEVKEEVEIKFWKMSNISLCVALLSRWRRDRRNRNRHIRREEKLLYVMTMTRGDMWNVNYAWLNSNWSLLSLSLNLTIGWIIGW